MNIYLNKKIIDNLEQINYDLSILYNFFCNNKFTLNITKSQFINFHTDNIIIIHGYR